MILNYDKLMLAFESNSLIANSAVTRNLNSRTLYGGRGQ